LLFFAVNVGVLPGVLDGFFRVAEELGFVAEIAFGVFQDFLVPLLGSGGIGCTSHVGGFLGLGWSPAGRLVRIHLPGEKNWAQTGRLRGRTAGRGGAARRGRAAPACRARRGVWTWCSWRPAGGGSRACGA